MAPAIERRRLSAAKRRFREFYPGGFHDEDYVVMERLYKWEAHTRWRREIDPSAVDPMVAVAIESRTNLLFSFEKMAVRDAARDAKGGRQLSEGLTGWLYGRGSERDRFERWIDVLQDLPRKQTRVATWPAATVFGFIAKPKVHLFLKPTVTRRAADACGFPFDYRSALQWQTYASLLDFAKTLRRELADWKPRDMIDIQSFIWVLGSSEYD